MCAAAVLGAAIATVPDRMGDLLEYCRWTRRLADEGLDRAYWPRGGVLNPGADPDWAIDYPPVIPYILWGLGRVARVLLPRLLESDVWLGFLIRLVFLSAHLGTAGALYTHLRAGGERLARAVMAAHLFNPALLFDTAYWGQADAVVAFAAVSAVALVMRGRRAVGWGCLAVAALGKPFAALLFLPFAIEAYRRSDRRWLVFAPPLGAATATLLVLAPFAAIARLGDIVRSVLVQVEAMPYASVNAHNLWWLLTGGRPWVPADTPWLAGFSFRHWGFAALAFVLLWAAVRLWRAESAQALPEACATVALGSFVCGTHMHENHLFLLLPLLSLIGLESRKLRLFYWVASASWCLNMVVHDPWLRLLAARHVPGPTLLWPAHPPLGPELVAYLEKHGYGHIITQEEGLTGVSWIPLTLLGSLVNVLLLAFWLARGVIASDARLPSRRCAAAAAAATCALATVFLLRTRDFETRHYFLVHAPGSEHVAAEPHSKPLLATTDGPSWVLAATPNSERRYRIPAPPSSTLAFAPVIMSSAGRPVVFEVEVRVAGRGVVVYRESVTAKSSEATRRRFVELPGRRSQPLEIVLRTVAEPGHDDVVAGWAEPGFV